MSKKKYKLKGHRPPKTLCFGETPEGVRFIELSDKTNTMRLCENGVIELYKNGELVNTFDPTLKPVEPQPIKQVGDFEISQTSYGEKVIYRPKYAKGGRFA